MRSYSFRAILLFFIISCNNQSKFSINNKDYQILSKKIIDDELLAIDELFNKNLISTSVKIQKLDTLYKYSLNSNIKESQQDILRRIGNIYQQMGEMDKAIYYQLKGIAISESLGDSDRYYATSINLSGIYIQLNLPNKAILYTQKALPYFVRNKYKIPMANAAINHSMALSGLNDSISAAFYAQKALLYKIDIPDSQSVYKCDSCEYLLNAINITKKISSILSDSLLALLPKWIQNEPNQSFKCRIYAYCANNYMRIDKIKSKEYKDSCLKYFNQYLLNDEKKEIYNDLKGYFYNSGQFHWAFKYTELASAMNDSFYNSEKLQIVSNSNNLYELLTNKEIKLLKYEKQTKNIWLIGLSFLVSLLVIASLLYQRNTRQKLKIKSSEIDKLLQSQELNLIDATLMGQNKERQRIAQELHDGIGSNLARAKMHFSVMEKELDRLKESNKEQYAEMSSILEETLKEVRRISHDMYGSTVIKFGLKVATQQLLTAVESLYQIKCSLYSKNLPEMEYDIEINIYRIIQELLSNSLKHAEAKRIDIQVIRDNDAILLSYEDNGKGFEIENSNLRSGLGLLSIKNRIQILKGTFKIESKQNKGFLFFADIPVKINPI